MLVHLVRRLDLGDNAVGVHVEALVLSVLLRTLGEQNMGDGLPMARGQRIAI